MKVRYFAGPDEPLHASGAKMLTLKQREAFSMFFSQSRLPRVVCIIEQPPLLLPNTNALNLLQGMLTNDLARAICERPVVPDHLVIAYEHSERLSPKIAKMFGSISMELDSRTIPVDAIFTPKKPANSFLEMADQIAWRGQRQFKEYNPKNEIMPEFEAVIPRNAKHAVYRELRVASYSGEGDPN